MIGTVSFLFLIILLGACRPVDALPDPNDPSQTGRHPQVVVLHTNDTWAYYDPCG
jgi:hypothetical protein